MTQPPEPGSGYSPPPGFPPPGPAGPAGSAPAGAVTIPGRGPVQLATVGQRFLARLVDAVIFGVLYAVLAAVGVGGMNATVDPQTGEPSTVG